MTEGLGKREITVGEIEYRCVSADCGRSVYLDLAVGQSPSQIGQHGPIPPQITDASTDGAEPIYLCRVVRKRCPPGGALVYNSEMEGWASMTGLFFESALYVGRKPHDN